jgi:hypothetical protein
MSFGDNVRILNVQVVVAVLDMVDGDLPSQLGLLPAFPAGPAVVSLGGTPTYFVVGGNEHIYSRDLSSSSFTSYPWWCVGHPALATFNTTTYPCLSLTDGTLWYATNSGRLVSAQSLEGALIDGVGLAATSTGPVFFVDGGDGAVYQRSISKGWT